MSLGESQGGLPPDRVTEDEEAILRDSRRVVETYHDPAPYAMRRVALAPCSPFSVSPDLMRESAALARSFGTEMGVRLHTHLAETLDEEAFCLEAFGQRPVAYAESLGWTGDDVWHAHCVHMNDAEIDSFAATRTGVAHCPSSNMRLASGIAPIRRMQCQGRTGRSGRRWQRQQRQQPSAGRSAHGYAAAACAGRPGGDERTPGARACHPRRRAKFSAATTLVHSSRVRRPT